MYVAQENHMSTVPPLILASQRRVRDYFGMLIPHSLLQRTDPIQFITL